MITQVYESPGWKRHDEVQLRAIRYPQFEGCPFHVVITRTYEGPGETYTAAALNTLDRVYNGVAAAVTGTTADNVFTYAADHELNTGDLITLAVTTGLTGLAAGDYFLIRLDARRVQLASSIANAAAGTALTFSADGTGTLTPPPAYLVLQSDRTPVDGGAERYTRSFATIPPSWTDEVSNFSYTFPAFTAGGFSGNYAILALSVGSGKIAVTNASSTGITVGTGVLLRLTFTRNGRTWTNFTYSGKAVATTDSTHTTIPGDLPGSGAITSVSGFVSILTEGRADPVDLIAASRMIYDYALSTAASLNTDLPLVQRFKAVDSGGVETKYLTSSTAPSNADYYAIVAASGDLVDSCSRSRYLGNIYVRATRVVTAQ